MDLSSPGIVEHALKGILHWIELLNELRNRGHTLTDQEKDAVSGVAVRVADLADRLVEFADRDDDNG